MVALKLSPFSDAFLFLIVGFNILASPKYTINKPVLLFVSLTLTVIRIIFVGTLRAGLLNTIYDSSCHKIVVINTYR